MPIRKRLLPERTSNAAWVIVAAFSAYFCMYAFRKPLSAGTYEGRHLGDLDYKTVLLIAQVLGYTLSKFVGIRVIAELKPRRRLLLLGSLIAAAEVALLAFALTPPPWNIFWVFFNGLPLGMIWGIVFSFLEGRRHTEMLGAGLCASFVVASGVVKWLGRLLIEAGLPEFWMPFCTGAIFAAPLAVAMAMLARVAPPSGADEDARTPRVPMDGAARRAFFLRFAPGIVLLTAIYTILNAYRDFRDNFAPEIWAGLDQEKPEILATAEVPIAIIVLLLMSGLVLVRDNRHAFLVNFGIVLVSGMGFLGLTGAYERGGISPVVWMIGMGLCLYLPYIAFHVLLWERLIATFRIRSNIGFLMYICDAFGYLGAVGVMLYHDVLYKSPTGSSHGASFLSFFERISYGMGWASLLLGTSALTYFLWKLPRSRAAAEDVTPRAELPAA